MYEVELPSQVNALINIFAIGVSFGVEGIGSIMQCMAMPGYLPILVMHMVTPVILAVVILLLGLLYLCCTATLCSASALLEMVAPYLLQLFFLAYPLVTKIAFDAFSCYKFNDGEFLKTDVTIQCTSSLQHHELLAIIAICLYPVGLIIVYAAMLFKARHAILSKKPTSLSRSIAFLYREYKPHMFW